MSKVKYVTYFDAPIKPRHRAKPNRSKPLVKDAAAAGLAFALRRLALTRLSQGVEALTKAQQVEAYNRG